jgi:DeoR family transcriptional regulator, glycerol-3-phosphate regulon repressor
MRNLKVKDRQSEIVSALKLHGSLSVTEIASLLAVSPETIRRDAAELAGAGDVLKMHGALALPHHMAEASFELRMREAAPAKRSIARAAIQLVRDGDSLVIDTGSTTAIFARELRARRNLTVVTNSTEIARTLADVPGNTILLAGGELDADTGATCGTTAIDFVSRFKVKHCFLTVTALQASYGAFDAKITEAEFAKAAMGAATHRVVLADASKFGAEAFARICPFSDIEVLVTERAPSPEFFATFKEANTRLVIAEVQAAG